MSAEKHAGWRSRGYLPHCDAAGILQHVVFSLADSAPPGTGLAGDDLLDAGAGACLLREPEAARAVEDAMLYADGVRYRLLAWCVMPNHVHVVFEQFAGERLDRVVQAWKSVAAHQINAKLKRRGQVWRREYFDRFIRDLDHYSATLRYVENNPVKAGLAPKPEDWPFSSAHRRRP